jgi:hypothetical protein
MCQLPKVDLLLWPNVHALALRWDMQHLADSIIDHVTESLNWHNNAQVLQAALLMDNQELANMGLERLVTHSDPLTASDMRILGFELAAKITKLRELNRSTIHDEYQQETVRCLKQMIKEWGRDIRECWQETPRTHEEDVNEIIENMKKTPADWGSCTITASDSIISVVRDSRKRCAIRRSKMQNAKVLSGNVRVMMGLMTEL